MAISPKAVTQEKRRDLTPEMTEIKIAVSQELIQKLDQLKALWSHQNPGMTDLELLQKMADFCLKKTDLSYKKTDASLKKTKSTGKLNSGQDTENTKSLRTSEVNPRYISAEVKRAVWTRDQGQCTFQGCSSKHFLEYDHIKPMSFGGKSTLENLRLLCRAHNQRAAIEKMGFAKMNFFLN